MKCPKCSYIGFEATERCRNCGYEFALAVEEPSSPELALRSGEADGPLTDLALRVTPAASSTPRAPGAKPPLDLDRVIGEPSAADLPLFAGGARERHEEDAPAVATRRPPVRRPPPDLLRGRRTRDAGDHAGGTLSLPLPETREPAAAEPPRVSAPAAQAGPAPPVPRLLAALFDTLLLTGIDLLVVYFTVRLVGLAFGDWTALPLLPLLAFFLLLNGGYLVAFTAAGGQTIGKMAFGLRVVPESDGPLSVGRAAIRALGAIASACCLGAGLLPALLHEGGRSVPDRLADTRVIRVA
jgi:uncharacterized RDD family membrane protein YckC